MSGEAFAAGRDYRAKQGRQGVAAGSVGMHLRIAHGIKAEGSKAELERRHHAAHEGMAPSPGPGGHNHGNPKWGFSSSRPGPIRGHFM